jgi:hypothetical protein
MWPEWLVKLLSALAGLGGGYALGSGTSEAGLSRAKMEAEQQTGLAKLNWAESGKLAGTLASKDLQAAAEARRMLQDFLSTQERVGRETQTAQYAHESALQQAMLGMQQQQMQTQAMMAPGLAMLSRPNPFAGQVGANSQVPCFLRMLMGG